MTKKEYITPEMERVDLPETADVVTASDTELDWDELSGLSIW